MAGEEQATPSSSAAMAKGNGRPWTSFDALPVHLIQRIAAMIPDATDSVTQRYRDLAAADMRLSDPYCVHKEYHEYTWRSHNQQPD